MAFRFFIGDGIMALFGLKTDPKTASKQAFTAVQEMERALVILNEEVKGEVTQQLRIGVGLHVGPAIVGELGYGDAKQITAIGDVVNTASRLESMTKEAGCFLIA